MTGHSFKRNNHAFLSCNAEICKKVCYYCNRRNITRGQVKVVSEVSANPNVTSFRIRKCKTVTYQNSFFNRTARIWNILPECIRMSTSIQSFKLKLLEYFFEALRTSYDPEEPRTWKSICVKCKNARLLNCPVTCCF